jgi:hypothetical protein
MEALQAEMKTHQETNNEKFQVIQENMCTMQQWMEAKMEVWLEKMKSNQEKMKASQQEMKAGLEEIKATVEAGQDGQERAEARI